MAECNNRKYNFTNVTITERGLTVTYTDGNSSRWPKENKPANYKANEPITYYCSADETRLEFYLSKLGGALAQAILEVTAVLTGFPKGYALFDHFKECDSEIIRRDTYLFGSSISRFRSPHEFEEHLLWMASDKTNKCICKYCRPSELGAWRGKETELRSLPNDIIARPDSKPVNIKSNKRDNKSNSQNLSLTNSGYDIDNTFRRGEIVWSNVKQSLDITQQRELSRQLGEELNDRIEYWPAMVINRIRAPYVSKSSVRVARELEFLYDLQILLINNNLQLQPKAIKPWRAFDANKIILDFENIKYTARDELVVKYIKAVKRAIHVASIFTPVLSYEYKPPISLTDSTKNEVEKRYYQQILSFTHFKTIMFGPELFRINDFIQFQDSGEQSILRIKSIYHDENNDMKIIGELLHIIPEKDGHSKLVPKNSDNSNRIIDILQALGRFYSFYKIKCNTVVKEQKSAIHRENILSGRQKQELPYVLHHPFSKVSNQRRYNNHQMKMTEDMEIDT
ncbi:519_t:CDS:2 [Diversispora eburnea]|uniref:519_t:CDS:1 n=1 Tax=Diversispora eburnea TaxID=1213867 RepID=A0A9N8UUX5_9GLOM|nr:519_t:CDS:2 [Diversispora eburnea]